MSRHRPARYNERFVKGGSHGDCGSCSCAQEGIFSAARQRRFLQDCGRARPDGASGRQARARFHGDRSRADHRGLLGPGPVPARDHPEAARARRQYRGGRVPGLWLRRRQLAAERLHRHGDGAHRLLRRYLLGRSHWSLGGLDLSVRRRDAEAALAAADDALGEDRLFRINRAARGFRDIGWNANNLSPRRRYLDPQRPEEVDRQLHILRHKCHLGAR